MQIKSRGPDPSQVIQAQAKQWKKKKTRRWHQMVLFTKRPQYLPIPPHSLTHSLLTLDTIIRSEPRIPFNPTILDRPKTSHKQRRKPRRPVLQVPLGQTAHPLLDIRTHILIVVFLVAQRTQQIQHFGAVVFALFAERVEEGAVEFALPVFVFCAGNHHVGVGFEVAEVGRGWVAGFVFKVV